MTETPKLPRTSAQFELALHIEKEVEVDGVGMGVLSDGTPYLTMRGLARMCGVNESSVRETINAWNDIPSLPRVARIRLSLRDQNFAWDKPYLVLNKDGATHHAVPDVVCMAFLEYYAFDAKPPSAHAISTYRLLARKTLRDFIYAGVGYDPAAVMMAVWKQFHERIDLNYDRVPDGYFSIFKETASMQLALIREGVVINRSLIPDLSVGIVWGNYWREHKLAALFQERKPYLHFYPASYPQARSNPQQAHCYPDAALGYFKKWLREVYFVNNLPVFLQKKTKDGSISAPLATAALAAIQQTRSLPPAV